MVVLHEGELSGTQGYGGKDTVEGHSVTHQGVASMIQGLVETGKTLMLVNTV